jgi:hypothetical protein
MSLRRLSTTVAAATATSWLAVTGCTSAHSSKFVDDADTAHHDAGHTQDARHDSHMEKDAGPALGVTEAGKRETSTFTEAGFNDARPNVDVAIDACDPDATSGPGPARHVCIIYPPSGDDMNECDGYHDPPGLPALANGTNGNGFDDNCNGLVDEGCACDAVGTTKACYLVPASQTVNGLPAGWCAQNSAGTVDCAQHAEGVPKWSGICRGAQPPYADFDCDGKDENPSGTSCACKSGDVQCPTDPTVTVPYPPPANLPLKVDATPWFVNPADVASATSWTWTLTGGDCDNILPHPTFGLYATSSGTGAPVGTQKNNLGTSGKEHGMIATAPTVTSAVYPAFSLSGDYVLTGAFSLNGTQYACSVKVEVRAPGIRAEGCWDTVLLGDDVDLHMAKINDFPSCNTSHAWSNQACSGEDCFYGDCYSGGGTGNTVDWGYSYSPKSACTGWGSQSTGLVCHNPRLDRDTNGVSGKCDPAVTNPNGRSAAGPFCGPENINVDHPTVSDRFAVGLRFYGRTSSASDAVRSHVNVYCDGTRVLSAGYDPVAGNMYPQLWVSGGDTTGDMWKVAILTTTVTGTGLSCSIAPTQSTNFHASRDGSSAYCVDDSSLDGPTSQEYLTAGGLEPANANALCFH